MYKLIEDYSTGTERITLNGQEIQLGDRVEAILYDDNGKSRIYRGTVTTAAAVGAAGTRLWVDFEGFYDYTLEYLRGCGIPARFA